MALVFCHNPSLRRCVFCAQVVEYVYSNGMAFRYPEPLDKEAYVRSVVWNINYDSFLPDIYDWPGVSHSPVVDQTNTRENTRQRETEQKPGSLKGVFILLFQALLFFQCLFILLPLVKLQFQFMDEFYKSCTCPGNISLQNPNK